MKTALVLYYSRTGNTEKMAEAVAQAIKNGSNITVELAYHVDVDELANFDAIVVGSPTYHHDMPIDFKNLFEEAAVKGVNLSRKVGAAFGSYGWSGEAPKLLLEIMKNKFGMQVLEPPLLAKYAPDQNSINACAALGKRVSESLMNQVKQ